MISLLSRERESKHVSCQSGTEKLSQKKEAEPDEEKNVKKGDKKEDKKGDKEEGKKGDTKGEDQDFLASKEGHSGLRYCVIDTR